MSIHERVVPGTIPSSFSTANRCSRAIPVSALSFYMSMCRGRLLKAPWIEEAIELSALMIGQSRHFNNQSGQLLLNSSAYRYTDFEDTSFRGRVGNTLGLLIGESLGYRWFAHFKEVVPSTIRSGRETPDFLAVSDSNVTALECKGSTAPNIKAYTFWKRLQVAHNNQVVPWIGQAISSTRVSAGLVVGGRVNQSNSANVFVIDSPSQVVRPSTSPSVILSNYDVWFTLMGIPQARTLVPLISNQFSGVTFGRFLFQKEVYIVASLAGGYNNYPYGTPFASLIGPNGPVIVGLPEQIMQFLLTSRSNPVKASESAQGIATYLHLNQPTRNNEGDDFPTFIHESDRILQYNDGALVLAGELQHFEVSHLEEVYWNGTSFATTQ